MDDRNTRENPRCKRSDAESDKPSYATLRSDSDKPKLVMSSADSKNTESRRDNPDEDIGKPRHARNLREGADPR